MTQANILDYGAFGDGKTLNTQAFAVAVKDCRNQGDGVIAIPAGIFRTGPIPLKNNVHLHLQEQTIILFTDDMSEYPSVQSRWESVECHSHHPCILTRQEDMISITDRGIIDSNGHAWWRRFMELKNSCSDRCLHDRDRDFQRLNAGIDLSSHVRVSRCVSDVNDDCLCLKVANGKDGLKKARPCENYHY